MLPSNNENECTICHESTSSGDIYTIPECGHSFHTNCIVTWFRVNNTCPLCKDTGINSISLFSNARDTNFYFKRAMTWSRRKDAPADLKNDAQKVKHLKSKLKVHRKQFSSLQSSNGQYKIISKEIRKYSSLIHQTEYRLYTMKRILANYVKSVLIIPIKRTVD